jgi:hypothetical protein
MAKGSESDRVAKRRHWRETLVRWRRSGHSVRQFCREAEISEALFYYWKRTLVAGDRGAASRPSARRKTSPQLAALPRLVPLEILASTGASATGSGIEITWPDGLRLRIFRDVDADQLTHVLRALERVRGGSSPC